MYTKQLTSIALFACIAYGLTHGNLLQATKYKQEAAEQYEGIEETLMGTGTAASTTTETAVGTTQDEGKGHGRDGNRRNNKCKENRKKQSQHKGKKEKQGNHEEREK
jgi:hypothetical protein